MMGSMRTKFDLDTAEDAAALVEKENDIAKILHRFTNDAANPSASIRSRALCNKSLSLELNRAVARQRDL